MTDKISEVKHCAERLFSSLGQNYEILGCGVTRVDVELCILIMAHESIRAIPTDWPTHYMGYRVKYEMCGYPQFA